MIIQKNIVDLNIDTIFMDKTAIPVQRIVEHLEKFGLITKLPESLMGGAALAFLFSNDIAGDSGFRRGNGIS